MKSILLSPPFYVDNGKRQGIFSWSLRCGLLSSDAVMQIYFFTKLSNSFREKEALFVEALSSVDIINFAVHFW